MELTVFNIEGKEVSTITLDRQVWEGRVNLPLLSQAVAMYRTNLRAGRASTKTRGKVSGGGKKPWRQKHTGRARAGSIRSPLWRHGGIVFGPHPRPFFYRLPEAMRRQALLESLKGKLRDDEVVLLDRLAADTPKTKPFASLAKVFGAKRRSLLVLDQPTEPLVKSLRNLAQFELCSALNLNAFDVVNAKKILVTTTAFARLERRIKGEIDAAAN